LKNKYLDEYEKERIDSQKDFHKEILWLCKKYSVKPSEVEIDAYHATGEVCIFINGKWYGYIDFEFYKMMDGLESYWDD